MTGDRRANGVDVGDVKLGAAERGDGAPGEGVLEVLAEHPGCSGDEVACHWLLLLNVDDDRAAEVHQRVEILILSHDR